MGATKEQEGPTYSEGIREQEEQAFLGGIKEELRTYLVEVKELLICSDRTLRVVIFFQIKEVATINQARCLGVHLNLVK